MKKEKTTQFLMKPKVDFCFKELMEDEEVRNAFLAAVLGINVEDVYRSAETGRELSKIREMHSYRDFKFYHV